MNTAPAIPTEATGSVESLETSIVRLTDAIGHLNPKRWGQHAELDRVKFELPRLPGMNCHTLAELVQLPEANEVIRVKCNHCDAVLACRRVVAPFVACDSCIKKAKDAEAMERHRKHWERVCPDLYRKTDTKHAEFPASIWAGIKASYDADSRQSFFFYGPTGSAKTRTAMLLLKRALLRRDSHVEVIWPEKLNRLTERAFDGGETFFDRMAKVGLLLLDDALLTACREPKLMDALKLLIDARMRSELPTVITSQIGSEDDLKEGKEFGEAKAADLERIKALLRRLREKFSVVPFGTATPKEGEGSF